MVRNPQPRTSVPRPVEPSPLARLRGSSTSRRVRDIMHFAKVSGKRVSKG